MLGGSHRVVYTLAKGTPRLLAGVKPDGLIDFSGSVGAVMNDLLNALVALVSIGLMSKSVMKARAEKSSKGIYWGQAGWDVLKSVWSIVYYKRLLQPYSVVASVLFFVVSLIFTLQLLKHRKQ